MLTMTINDSEGLDIAIPARYEVCGRCHGTGKHVNPSIDGHGISGDDECWDDDDFRENYFGGLYDVTCQQCDGRNVVLIPDDESLTPEQAAQLEAWQEFTWRDAEERRMEARWGL
jgi:hypothetical protein